SRGATLKFQPFIRFLLDTGAGWLYSSSTACLNRFNVFSSPIRGKMRAAAMSQRKSAADLAALPAMKTAVAFLVPSSQGPARARRGRAQFHLLIYTENLEVSRA